MILQFDTNTIYKGTRIIKIHEGLSANEHSILPTSDIHNLDHLTGHHPDLDQAQRS
jgi:hypothetical protein